MTGSSLERTGVCGSDVLLGQQVAAVSGRMLASLAIYWSCAGQAAAPGEA
jgi:hypothetical protein